MPDDQDAKPSRYRSQRKAPASTSPPAPGAGEGVGRSRSRYHHNRPATAHAQDQQSPSSSHRMAQVPSRSLSTRGREHSSDAGTGAQDDSDRGSRSRHKNAERSKSPQRIDPSQFRDAPTMLRAKAEAYVPEAEDGDIPVEENSGCFGLFKRKKDSNRPVSSEKRLAPRPVVPKSSEPATIRPGGGGVVPGIDAPVSASNAGGRRVLIECNKQSIFLPIDPTTTASDLIASAANCLSEKIDPRASVLLEYFVTVGVQRPLRRYEHIRDVMNSWDDDRANSLLVVPARAIDANPGGLSASNVPREKPANCSFLMQYSHKPGSWDKRLITIHQDGQIVMSKISKESETTNICHLSDFDIYIPTAKQTSKKIKPPKKLCYAIKSQQKTNMFESASNYVHFFCTGEHTLGTSFYNAVQAWRSWYLVNVMGEGKKPKTTELGRSASKATKQSSHKHQQSTGSMDAHYQLGSYKPLMDLTGFDRPTSSHAQETSPSAPIATQSLNSVPSRKLSTRDKLHTPVSHSKTPQLADNEPLVNLAANQVHLLNRDDAFTGEGLLGRSYSTRQRQQAEREAAVKNPWTNNSAIQNDQVDSSLNRQTSVKRAASNRRPNGTGAHEIRHRPSTRDRERVVASDDLKRSGSTRAKDMPKPLIDLTPTYKPPPQHVRKGRGVRPDNVGPGGLIDNATSLEQPYFVPSSHDWRGRANAPAAAGDVRPRSRSRSAVNNSHMSNNPNDQAFTGAGLLSGAHNGHPSKEPASRGGISGNRNATQPLLDVSEEANYAPGSLLSKVARAEREEGRGGPTLDRSA